MRLRGEAAHDLGGIGDEVADRNVFVDDAVDERGVRAVFEQAAHEIRQQIFVRADRRVDAARHIEIVLADHFGIKIGAHAVQALEFERAAVRHVVDRGDRVRVVRRELRVDQIRARVEQAARAGEIRHVGVRFARVDGIAATGPVPASA